jgi:hypothetical protein
VDGATDKRISKSAAFAIRAGTLRIETPFTEESLGRLLSVKAVELYTVLTPKRVEPQRILSLASVDSLDGKVLNSGSLGIGEFQADKVTSTTPAVRIAEGIAAERRDLYLRFAEAKVRRLAFYERGFALELQINSFIGDLDRAHPQRQAEMPALKSDLDGTLKQHEQWVKEKAEHDAVLAGLLTRVRLAYRETPELNKLLSEPSANFLNNVGKAPSDEREAREWVEPTVERFQTRFRAEFRAPLDNLESFLAKQGSP